MFAFEKIGGLDREKLLAAIEPVLQAHGVRGVELIWRTDHRGRVLYITVEADAETQDSGVTLELCAEVSRDISAALDVVDAISAAYRLEVGSPGVERALYGVQDFQRFAGRLVKLKLLDPVEGQFTLRGHLESVLPDEVGIATDTGAFAVPLAKIKSANLVLDWKNPGASARSHDTK